MQRESDDEEPEVMEMDVEDEVVNTDRGAGSSGGQSFVKGGSMIGKQNSKNYNEEE